MRAFLYTWGGGRTTAEGEHIPFRADPLKLLYEDHLSLVLPLTLEHEIDERSPLYGHTYDSLTVSALACLCLHYACTMEVSGWYQENLADVPDAQPSADCYADEFTLSRTHLQGSSLSHGYVERVIVTHHCFKEVCRSLGLRRSLAHVILKEFSLQCLQRWSRVCGWCSSRTGQTGTHVVWLPVLC